MGRAPHPWRRHSKARDGAPRSPAPGCRALVGLPRGDRVGRTDSFIATATLRVIRDAPPVRRSARIGREAADCSAFLPRRSPRRSVVCGRFRASLGTVCSTSAAWESRGPRLVVDGWQPAHASREAHVEVQLVARQPDRHPRRGGAVASFLVETVRAIACREDDVGVVQPPRRPAQPLLRLGRLVRRRCAFEARASGRPTAAR